MEESPMSGAESEVFGDAWVTLVLYARPVLGVQPRPSGRRTVTGATG